MTVTTIVIINAYFDLNITFITTNDISVRPSIEIYKQVSRAFVGKIDSLGSNSKTSRATCIVIVSLYVLHVERKERRIVGERLEGGRLQAAGG